MLISLSVICFHETDKWKQTGEKQCLDSNHWTSVLKLRSTGTHNEILSKEKVLAPHPLHGILQTTERQAVCRYLLHLPLHSMTCRWFPPSCVLYQLRLSNWSAKFGKRAASGWSQRKGREHFALSSPLFLTTELWHLRSAGGGHSKDGLNT